MAQVFETLRFCAPSVLTLGALVSGLTAARFASEERFSESVICVMLAAVLDGMDGHVARYLGASTDFGFELDSLCDLANFGVTPALVVYFWAKSLPTADCISELCQVDHTLLWIACCIYAGCCACRLARFNVAGHKEQMDEGYMQSTASKRPPVPKALRHNIFQRRLYFKGVPAPVGAAYAMAPMMLRFSEASHALGVVGQPGAWAVGRRGTAVTLLATAALMVSTLPTFSSKMLKTGPQDSHLRSRHWSGPVVKGILVLMCCYSVFYFPFDVMLFLDVGHMFSIPVGLIVFYSCAVAAHSRED